MFSCLMKVISYCLLGRLIIMFCYAPGNPRNSDYVQCAHVMSYSASLRTQLRHLGSIDSLLMRCCRPSCRGGYCHCDLCFPGLELKSIARGRAVDPIGTRVCSNGVVDVPFYFEVSKKPRLSSGWTKY